MQILGGVWRQQDFKIVDRLCFCIFFRAFVLSSALHSCILQLKAVDDYHADEIHVVIGSRTKDYVYPKGPRELRKSGKTNTLQRKHVRGSPHM
jgi:hypothetical protein